MNTRSVFVSLLVTLEFLYTDAACTFPNDLRGIWVSLYNGPMVFGTNTISGYNTTIINNQQLDLECIDGNSTFFLLKSSRTVVVFGQHIHLYLCLEIEEQAQNVYQYYIRTDFEHILNEYIKGHTSSQEVGEVCVKGTDNPILLVRNVSLYEGSVGLSCPSIMRGYYGNVTIHGIDNLKCSDGFLDSCRQSTQFEFNIGSGCVNGFENTSFTCLHTIEKNEHFLYVYTDRNSLQTSPTFGIYCMILSKTEDVLGIKMFPGNCNNSNSVLDITFVNMPEVCNKKVISTPQVFVEEKHEAPLSPAIVAVIVIVVCISFVCVIVFVIHWQRKRLGLICNKQKNNSNNFDDIAC